MNDQAQSPFRYLVLWGILAAAIGVKIAWLGSDRQVFQVFAAASRHWWDDRSLYGSYQPTEGIDGYRYSPTFAVAFSPLGLLPERAGAMLWIVLSIGVLAYSVHRLARDVLPPPDGDAWTPRQERQLQTLTLFGSAVGLWSGQSNALLAALAALALSAIVRRRWWTASWLLAAAVYIKIWPLAIVLLLAVFWPRPLVGRFLIVCLALALVPFLTRPPAVVAWQYHEWYQCLVGPLQARNTGYRDAWTFWEQLSPWVHVRADWSDPTSHRAFMAIGLAAAFGALGWCLWQARRLKNEEHPGRLLTAIFSIWAAWQLLFGPGTEQFTYGIIAPAAAWAVVTSLAERRARWLTILAWTLLALAPAGDIETTVARVFPQSPILAPVGAVLFVVWLVWHERGKPLDRAEIVHVH